MGYHLRLTVYLLAALLIIRGSTKLIRDDSSCCLLIIRAKSPRRRILRVLLPTERGEIAGSFPPRVTGR